MITTNPDGARYLVFIYFDYPLCCEMRHLSEKILKINIYIESLLENARSRSNLIKYYFFIL